jgi:two-component system chemotaxis sensor kinase CheA
MDALTTAAFDSLVKDVLPKLQKRLAAMQAVPPDQRASDSELQFLVAEAQELLTLMGSWTNSVNTVASDLPASIDESVSSSDDLSDEEAMALLTAEGTAEVDTKNMSQNLGHKSMADALSDDNIEDEREAGTDLHAELSDADAMALLGTKDEPALPAPENSAAPLVPAGAEEISDDDAMALLSAMDAPTSAAPVAAAASDSEEMSDDDAMALLAAMDAPVTTAPPAATTGADEMSDDDAMALLAAMDAPMSSATTAAIATPTPAASAESADDEAMAMLLAMGGMDDGEKAHATAASNTPQSHSPSTSHGAKDDSDTESDADTNLEEIPEISKNDFASDPDMMNDFNTNTDELMETLNSTILQLEQNPTDKETIESIFRAAHTLKGAAGMFGFKAIERVMHRMENLFDQVRKGKLVPNGDTIDVVFQGIDVLRSLLDGVKQGTPSGTKTVPIVKALTKAATGKYVKGQLQGGAGGSAAPAVENSGLTSGGTSGDHGDEHKGGAKAAVKKSEASSTIRVDLERLDALVNLVGELVIDRTRFATIEEDIRSNNPQLKMASNLSETVQLFGRHMNEIHEIIMKIRMVPIGNAFNKFTRIVRDLSRQMGKEIDLFIDGETTELDKTLVEQIGDPLIHLIRNACDHGIEMPDKRQSAGKPRSGRVFLSARQEGNQILITIEDDGKGMNAEAIRKKGIERGLITEDQALSQRDILNLIFEAGFSTAEKVTEVSGRGVGMDVVRKQISKLKGSIDLTSEVGKGSTITIQLPLTLAIVQSLLIEAEDETFAIPLSSVVESVRIKPDEIQRVGEVEVIKRHGRVLPLMHLDEILNLKIKNDSAWYANATDIDGAHRAAAKKLRDNRRKERLFVVIVGNGDRRFGIVVDQLLNQQEMVIKSLGKVMSGTPCVAGGAVLGNGEVVLVLDLQELEDKFRTKSRGNQAA